MEKRRIAVVTGAGREKGIGAEVARQLADRGWHVVLTARRREDAEARVEALANGSRSMEAAALDVTDEATIEALAASLRSRFGRLDALVNNAAATTGPYGETASGADLAGARQSLEVTVLGSWRVSQALLPLLLESQSGRLVMVSSGAGSHGDPLFGLRSDNAMGPSYAVAKAALNALVATFARELEGRPIRVNAVCPGFTATFDGAEAMGARPVAEGAASVLWGVELPDDGPSGGFFRDGEPLPW